MKLIDRTKAYIDNHYKTPKGLLGMYIGEKMVRQHEPETRWTIELMKLQQGESVLDLGCGAGLAVKLILERFAVEQVVGLDLSPVMIRSAKRRNKKELGKRAKFVKAGMNSLPFQDKQFDKVFSIHTIYFWDDFPETVSEIMRVLKPGGSFIVTLTNGKNDEIWEGVNTLVEEKLIPSMETYSCVDVQIVKGPNSRQFHTIAVMGKKKA
ncbi:class I SAM-dependent methyltransferase [Bacillus marinisedimentorum]|uniref:class I SAM-dependent methyltransferase n=1 Tax=Bacillus marinisedimentorum TaxID=1821260 RepID=UPI0008730E4D|nr:class I SAM-dependent methyltransferase [Bacillus marinisedimentorum]